MKKRIIIFISFLLMMFIGLDGVDAASFSVNAGSKNITKGGKTTLTIKGSDVTGRFNVSTSNASVVSISENKAWIENDSYSITLSALNVGTATITVTPSGVSDSNGSPVSLGAKTIQVTVSLPREKSSDNTLKSLSVEGFDITPQFNKDVLSYNAVVPEGTKSVVINAVKNESHATVTGAGTVEVKGGSNPISVIVKAENGVEKTYTINIDVKDANPINVKINDKSYTVVKLAEDLTKPEYFDETTVDIDGFSVPAFKNNNTNVLLVGLKDENGEITLFIYDEETKEYKDYVEIGTNKISIYPLETDETIDGYTKGEIEINGKMFDAFYLDKDSRFAIIYGMNIKTGEKGFYLYDKEDQSIIKYNDENDKYIAELNEKIDLYSYIIIGFGCIFVILLLIIIFKKPKRKQKKEPKVNKVTFDDDDDEKENEENAIIELEKNQKTNYESTEKKKKKKK